jgi:hypothetical protein
MESNTTVAKLPEMVKKHQQNLLATWVSHQLASKHSRPGLIKESELRQQSPKWRLVRNRQLDLGRGTGYPEPNLAFPGDPGILPDRNRLVCFLTQTASV